jgi:lipopolysaccharide transport system permease protein
MGRSLATNRNLVRQLTRRDVAGRYQGSALGLAWSLVAPLTMLAIYTFVFGVIFQARWAGAATTSTADYALVLFAGLIVHAFFAECVNRAPTLILTNTNLVKKVIFPLEILPWTSLGSALFHAAASFVVLLVAELLFRHSVPWTVVWLPIILLPLVLATVGFALALSALGVYVRDISQMTGMVTNILLFLSPVFYPATALPERFRWWFYLNPLTPVIEDVRGAALNGQSPDWLRWALTTVASLAIAQIGFWFFQRTRKGFADVL